MSGARWRLRSRPPITSVVAGVAWVVLAVYLVVQARLGPPLIWTDSRAYASMAGLPLWSTGFWAGPRPPLLPVVLKLVGGASAVVTAQAVIAALAWGVLAWTVGRLVPLGWRRLVATILVLGFASTLPVVMWNRSKLSESLSMSLLALVFATCIWTARRPTWPRVALTALACLAFGATRDAQIWTVGLLAAAAAVYALVARRTRPVAALRSAALALGLLGVVVLCEWGTLSSQRTVSDTTDVLLVRVFPYPERVAWFAAHGMPDAKRIDRLAAETPATPDRATLVAFPSTAPAFRPLVRWLHTDASRTYLLWLVEHPWYVVNEPLQRPEQAFNFANGNLDFYAPSTHVASSPLTRVLWPPLWVLVLLGAVALYAGIASGAWRSPPWQMVAVLTTVGVMAMLVAWHGDAQEVTRHTIEGFAEVRLGVWILLALGLLQMTVPELPRLGTRPGHPEIRPEVRSAMPSQSDAHSGAWPGARPPHPETPSGASAAPGIVCPVLRRRLLTAHSVLTSVAQANGTAKSQ